MALAADAPTLDVEDMEDLEDAPDHEVEAVEEEILDQATAARTIVELKAELTTLTHLEALARAVRRSGEDRKWRELSNLLVEIFTPAAIADRVEVALSLEAISAACEKSIRHGHPSTLYLWLARRPLAAALQPIAESVWSFSPGRQYDRCYREAPEMAGR